MKVTGNDTSDCLNYMTLIGISIYKIFKRGKNNLNKTITGVNIYVTRKIISFIFFAIYKKIKRSTYVIDFKTFLQA